MARNKGPEDWDKKPRRPRGQDSDRQRRESADRRMERPRSSSKQSAGGTDYLPPPDRSSEDVLYRPQDEAGQPPRTSKRPPNESAKQSVDKKDRQPPASSRPQSKSHNLLPEEKKRKENRRKATRSAWLSGIIVVIVLGFAAVLNLVISQIRQEKPVLVFMYEGTIEHTIGASALVIREEKLKTVDGDGTLVPMVVDGSRVAKGESVAMLVPPEMSRTAAELDNVRQQIVQLQANLMSTGKGAAAAVIFAQSDTSLLPIIHVIRKQSIENRVDGIPALFSSIQTIIEKRDSELQFVDFEDAELAALVASRDSLAAQLASQATVIRADSPGIISFRALGYEDVLNQESLSTLSADSVEEYTDKIRESSSQADLNLSKAIRLCKNGAQFIAVNLPGGSLKDFPADETKLHKIRVLGEGLVLEQCKVVRVEPYENGVFVVFSTQSYVERLLNHRLLEVEVILPSQLPPRGVPQPVVAEDGSVAEAPPPKERLKIPVSAFLGDYTQGMGEILLNQSGYATRYLVQVLDYDREFAIIERLDHQSSPGTKDILIANPGSVREGDRVLQ